MIYCKNQQNTKQNNNTRAQGKIIDNISLALMKQFNLFPVARGMLAKNIFYKKYCLKIVKFSQCFLYQYIFLIIFIIEYLIILLNTNIVLAYPL